MTRGSEDEAVAPPLEEGCKRWVPLAIRVERADLEVLWSRVTDNDAPSRFIRDLVAELAEVVGLRGR